VADWTVEVDTGSGFTEIQYTEFEFEESLNRIPEALVHLAETTPSEGDPIRITYNKGESNERTWFRGFITDLDQDENQDMQSADCHGDAYLLYEGQTGVLREWENNTPWLILQNSTGSLTSETGLIFNAQNSQVMQIGDGVAPNALGSSNAGDRMDFRAHTGARAGGLLWHINRLCEMAAVSGNVGLEWFVDRDSNDDARLNVVERRERASTYTNETFDARDNAHDERTKTTRMQEWDRVKVIGEGSGRARVESDWKGTGSKEFILQEKSIPDKATADNFAEHLEATLKNGGNPRRVFETYDWDLETRAGDDIDFVDKDGNTSTERVFGIRFSTETGAFTFETGRHRPFWDGWLLDAARAIDSMGFASQVTDGKPQTPKGENIVDRETLRLDELNDQGFDADEVKTVTRSPGQLPTDFEIAEAYHYEIGIQLSNSESQGASHSHQADMHSHSEEVISGIDDANSGSDGTDPHGHGFSTQSQQTGDASPGTDTATSEILGPWQMQMEIDVDENGDGNVDRTDVIMQQAFHALSPGDRLFQMQMYPWSMVAEGETLLELRWNIRNRANEEVSLNGTNTSVLIRSKDLHTHNA